MTRVTVHVQQEVCIFSERTLADTSCSRCCNPCVSFVCALLYTGSSVLQTDEAPVCSLDRVPQVLACDWLLACLQVTFMFSKLHQSASSSMWLILFIQQAAIVSVFFKGIFLAVVSNHLWLMVLQLTWFSVCLHHVLHFKLLLCLPSAWFAAAAFKSTDYFLVLSPPRWHMHTNTFTHTQVAVQFVVRCLATIWDGRWLPVG